MIGQNWGYCEKIKPSVLSDAVYPSFTCKLVVYVPNTDDVTTSVGQG